MRVGGVHPSVPQGTLPRPNSPIGCLHVFGLGQKWFVRVSELEPTLPCCNQLLLFRRQLTIVVNKQHSV